MARGLLLTVAFLLAAVASPAQAPGKTTIVNGAFVHNGRPFPMVLDAGTDTFTPQDYDTVMASKDGWGANTWWLQYNMLHMKSEAEGDFAQTVNHLLVVTMEPV